MSNKPSQDDINAEIAKIDREGREAKEILEHPAMRRAVEYLEENYTIAWKRGKTIEDREKAHSRWVALEDVILHLRTELSRREIIESNRSDSQTS